MMADISVSTSCGLKLKLLEIEIFNRLANKLAESTISIVMYLQVDRHRPLKVVISSDQNV